MKLLTLLLFYLPFFIVQANTDNRIKIAIIGKTKNDSFYQQSYQGCQAFSQKHPKVQCIYDGPQDYQDPRSQALVVEDLIHQGIDGLLISVTDSNHLAQAVLERAYLAKIPIFTFDSDLLPQHQFYRQAYVGTNNQDFGIALGNYAKELLESTPGNQGLPLQVCIHSGHQTTPNLNDRIKGVRLALSQGKSANRLKDNGNWVELDRCPLYSLGKRELAIRQLEFMLQQKQRVINIAVAGFAQFSPDYLSRISSYKEKISTKEAIIISADTEQIQLKALEKGLSTINIGQRPYEMGRLGTELLYQYLVYGQKPAKELYYLDFHYCTGENYASCTENQPAG
ncbi:substrate-binding domain-containing protein [Thalassomonas actiniarum]|uniref:Substrate-binding domain-containing protein n=1 Tax=Thalassomonas actiniarum TaxID=485447 RepID=A0AAE9YWU8_9GAMM|nr:substrate-binding domain-containing protein [Thalassomonas actiniarum]WDE00953.1 substrate-binding domain-containing protein [Thalassomonas actiniarum]